MLDIQGVLLEGRMPSLRRACGGGVEAVACGTARRGSNIGALLPGQNDWKARLRTQERNHGWIMREHSPQKCQSIVFSSMRILIMHLSSLRYPVETTANWLRRHVSFSSCSQTWDASPRLYSTTWRATGEMYTWSKCQATRQGWSHWLPVYISVYSVSTCKALQRPKVGPTRRSWGSCRIMGV